MPPLDMLVNVVFSAASPAASAQITRDTPAKPGSSLGSALDALAPDILPPSCENFCLRAIELFVGERTAVSEVGKLADVVRGSG